MRRAAVVIGIFLLSCTAACTLRRHAEPLSPYCRGGPPLAGVYHPQRLVVKSRCRVAVGTVHAVKFEDYDGDVHVDLRLDRAFEGLLDVSVELRLVRVQTPGDPRVSAVEQSAVVALDHRDRRSHHAR